MKPKTIIVPVAWTGNEYIENPAFVKLVFTEKDLQKINECQQLCKNHRLDKICISYYGIMLQRNKRSEETEYIADVQQLLIYQDSVIFYAQHKHDSSAQIETDIIKLPKTAKTVKPANKILITVEGGIVQSVDTNFEAEYVVVDYDYNGDEPVIVGSVNTPDSVIGASEKFHESLLFKGELHGDVLTAKKKLKKINY